MPLVKNWEGEGGVRVLSQETGLNEVSLAFCHRIDDENGSPDGWCVVGLIVCLAKP